MKNSSKTERKEYVVPSVDHLYFLIRNDFKLPETFQPPENAQWVELKSTDVWDVMQKHEFAFSPDLGVYRLIRQVDDHPKYMYCRLPESSVDDRKLSLRSAHRVPVKFVCGTTG